MLLFGLTGGIATGKSTVTQMLRELGLPVIDADALAREVVEPRRPALAEISARFPGVVEGGGLNRARLGALVSKDPDARAALNAITHPRIRALALEKTTALAQSGATHAIYDAALLLENKLHEGMNGVILVTCPVETQVARVMARDGLSEEAARARIASQMSTDEKRRYATWVIDNGGTREQTRQQVEAVARELRSRIS